MASNLAFTTYSCSFYRFYSSSLFRFGFYKSVTFTSFPTAYHPCIHKHVKARENKKINTEPTSSVGLPTNYKNAAKQGIKLNIIINIKAIGMHFFLLLWSSLTSSFLAMNIQISPNPQKLNKRRNIIRMVLIT